MRIGRAPTPASSSAAPSDPRHPRGHAALLWSAALLCLGCASAREGNARTDANLADRAGADTTAQFADSTASDRTLLWPAPAPEDRWFPTALLPLSGGGWVVAETDQNRLFLLDASGRVTARLPSPGRAQVEWTALAPAPGLAFYALDGPGRAVHQYDLRGNYLGVAADLAQVAAQNGLGPIEPAGLAVDRSGLAVVTDRTGDRLLVFGPGWSFRGTWGQTGAEPGSWRRPGAVAVGDRPPFIVADEGNARVVLIDELGGPRGSRSWAEPPRGVAVMGTGFAVARGRVLDLLDATLAPRRALVLPATGPCDGRAYATTALGAGEGLLLAGEGCSGRLIAYRVAGD